MSRALWSLLASLLALVVVAVGLRWMWGRSEEWRPPPVSSEAPEATADDASVVDPVGGQTTDTDGASRRALAPREALAIGEARLRIVRADDGGPLPGAEVWFRDDASLVAEHVDRRSWSLDPFSHVRTFGQRRVADAAGAVVVGSGIGQFAVGATFEDLVGFAWLEPPAPAGGYVLALAPRAPLTVEVVDVEGRPVEGAWPILLTWRGAWSEDHTPIGVTDASGRVVVEHPAPIFRGDSVTKTMVMASGPGLGSTAVAFERDPVPTTPVRVTLPPTGRIEIVVLTANDRPMSGTTVSVSPPTHGRDEVSLDAWLATDAAGRAVVMFAAIGRPMRAMVHTEPDPFFVDFDGPARAGEAVRVEARPEHTRTALLASLVDEHGTALADVPWDLELEGTRAAGTVLRERAAVRTDAAGRLVLVLGERLAGCEVLRGRLSAAGSLRRADPRAAEFSLRGRLAVGTRDLGGLTVRRAQPLMTGTLVAGDGRRVAQARAAFAHVDHERPAPRFQLDADGQFAVFATASGFPPTMTLSAPGCLPTDVPLRAGVRDLRVVLPRAASVQVAVRLDAGQAVLCGTLRCELLGPAGVTREARVSATADGGRAVFAELPEGTWAVRLWLGGHREPLHAIDGLDAGSAAGWDQHVVVDLRHRLRAMRVLLRGAGSEQPIAWGHVLVGQPRVGQGVPTPEGVRCDGDGLAHVAVLGEVVDLIAEAPGHVPLAWAGPPQNLTLTLQPLPELELHVVGLDAQPPGARVTVTLTAAAGAEATRWISGRRHTQDLTVSTVLEASRGRVRAPALGELVATLRIVLPGAPVATVPLRLEPTVITADTRRVTLHQ